MSLSKQLYIIISFIFLMIFTGNFIISVKNTKEYLEVESTTKAQDTATSLGMTLKAYIKDKKDPEIESIIKAIANRGFYKELRLEDIDFSFTSSEILNTYNKLNASWEITDVSIDKKYGTIQKEGSDSAFFDELAQMDSETNINSIEADEPMKKVFKFIPNEAYKMGGILPVQFVATNQGKTVKASVDMNFDKVLVRQTREVKFDYVPQWFINLIPMHLEETSSEISDGWNKAAIIYVSANPGDAYAKLYEQAKGAILYALIAFLISMALLVVFLRYILQPLKKIEKLATNIAQGNFETIKKLPWTTEIKNVAMAMNDMSTKIESVISKLNNNISNMTKQLSIDGLTGLQLKQTFETDLKKMFMSKSFGYILTLKIDDLASFANKNSSKNVNDFIKSFASILDDHRTDFSSNVTAYRFYGSEFALIAKEFTHNDIEKFISHLKKEFEALGAKIDKQSIAHIGATPFNPIGTTFGILDAANEAYQLAKQIGPNEAFIRDESDLTRDMQEWELLIYDIIDNGKFEVEYIGDAHILNGENEGKLFMQEAFTHALDRSGENIPIGTFVSIAEKYEKVIDFDKAVITKVIQHIRKNKIQHNISINLSLDSIENSAFILWIQAIIGANSDIASQLVFSITAYGVARDASKFKLFSYAIRESGAKIIIKRFETKFIPLDHIKEFNLDYIRLARDYTNNIANDRSKQGFVEAMQELSTLINIKVFAENVKEEEDYNTVKKLNLYGASR
ncbi:MAG: EAL domain-containing protein [Candidatus Marinarcus sp.]|uniref:bifunctional diguanylate cyclase/phosphodiesterase n=1 Tax=Candidatus Marinarcus sp. TaxID=3100987 RepID=UPI003B0040FF